MEKYMHSDSREYLDFIQIRMLLNWKITECLIFYYSRFKHNEKQKNNRKFSGFHRRTSGSSDGIRMDRGSQRKKDFWSDSSSIISIQYTHSDSRQDIEIEILQSVFRINRKCTNIKLTWITEHMGKWELADKSAKSATKKNVDLNIRISKNNVNSIIKLHIRKRWQNQWDKEIKARLKYSKKEWANLENDRRKKRL